jgi:hypothetical protein
MTGICRIHTKSYYLLVVVLVQKIISTIYKDQLYLVVIRARKCFVSNENWFIIFEMLSSDLIGSLAILLKVQQSHHGLGFDGLHKDEGDVEKSR